MTDPKRTYWVHITQEVSTTIPVVATSPEEARELIAESLDYPGSLTVAAFTGRAPVDSAGEWEPYSVELDGQELWCREESSDG